MTTWATFLSDLRADLQDTSSTKRWTDATLHVYTKDAIRDYSTWFPKRVDNYAMTLNESGVYALPLNFLQEIHVDAPQGTFLVHRREVPGTKPRTGKYYYIEGGNLYLGDTSLDEPYLTYLGSRDVPTAAQIVVYTEESPAPEGFEEFVFDVPDYDLELIRLYVKAKVYEQMRSRTASLDRFKLGSGSRDDNPVAPEVDDLMAVYHQKISERIPGGNIQLYRSNK